MLRVGAQLGQEPLELVLLRTARVVDVRILKDLLYLLHRQRGRDFCDNLPTVLLILPAFPLGSACLILFGRTFMHKSVRADANCRRFKIGGATRHEMQEQQVPSAMPSATPGPPLRVALCVCVCVCVCLCLSMCVYIHRERERKRKRERERESVFMYLCVCARA